MCHMAHAHVKQKSAPGGSVPTFPGSDPLVQSAGKLGVGKHGGLLDRSGPGVYDYRPCRCTFSDFRDRRYLIPEAERAMSEALSGKMSVPAVRGAPLEGVRPAGEPRSAPEQVLSLINSPTDVKRLPARDLKQLASELRQYIDEGGAQTAGL